MPPKSAPPKKKTKPADSTTNSKLQTPLYISIGHGTRAELFKDFEVNKHYKIKLQPCLPGQPQYIEIHQEGRQPICTTDFYFTNILPMNSTTTSDTITKSENNPPEAAAAAAAHPHPDIAHFTTPLLPGECRIYPSALTPGLPIADLRNHRVTSQQELEDLLQRMQLNNLDANSTKNTTDGRKKPNQK